MTEDHMDRAQRFLDNLHKLGEQIKAAESQQKIYLTCMLDLKEQGQTDTEEYAELDTKSKSLQAIIDKYRPIYLERMEMVKEVATIGKRKRTSK